MKNWITPYMKQFKLQWFLTLLFGLLGIASGALLLFTSGYLISKSSLRPENVMLVYIPIVAVRAFSIGQALFPYLEKLVSHDLVLRILAMMRTKLYKMVEPQALFLQSRYQTGDLLSVLSDDIERLQDLFLRTILPSIFSVIMYTVFIAVIGLFDMTFAIMMALVLGVIVFLSPFLSLFWLRRYHISQKKVKNRLYEQLTDAIFGITDWQASGRTATFLEDFRETNAALQGYERKLQNRHHIRSAIIQLVIGIVMMSVLIWSSIQVGEGVFAPTMIAAFTLMILNITDALVPISDAVEHYPLYVDSIKRINQIQDGEFLMDRTPLDAQKINNKKLENTFVETNKVNIKIDHVHYHYPHTDKTVLQDFTLAIPAGEKLAILGKSGTGKSTLLKLLTGMILPDKGVITINEKKASPEFLSTYISVFNQKPHLFDTTIGNNIRIGKPDATDEEVWDVIEQAQLTSLVSSLPQGLATPTREMGSRFSGGERQRIAFARVLLQKTPIILVDEATIGLDPKTEHDLIETMLHATKDKTVIWVTHHLASVEKMDRVIFLQDGNIAMDGSHAKLLETNARYQKLYEMDYGIHN
ncbi:thiol reductant ABC exporter subunit CydC [Virgibacillus soli]|uniref:thiol reductant ABC exporter subunit CydC n=1 Tax=Paracerasibacillus soli TaxID=480284 RepID=UPI0035E76236